MNKIKVLIAYDGTNYFGWQRQANAVTVSYTLEKAFNSVFKQSISLIGASRTDRGVHALGQVAVFKCRNLNIPLKNIHAAWNSRLPQDIFIRNLEFVANDFHPCFKVLQKTYYYHLFLSRPLPFWARYGWHYKFIQDVDFEKFGDALQVYVGEHDFASFCKVDDESKNTVRRIDSINVEKLNKLNALRVVIKGPGFLRFQIRRMIGYALDIARRSDLSINYLKHILENPDPRQTLTKAEASGLLLRRIIYK